MLSLFLQNLFLAVTNYITMILKLQNFSLHIKYGKNESFFTKFL